MKNLKEILKTPDEKLPDADHPELKDITKKEFDNALTEVVKKHKNKKSANALSDTEKEKRGKTILKALNSTEHPY